MQSAASAAAEAIAADAAAESPLWAETLVRSPDWQPVFSPLAADQFAVAVETIYEAYLVHYGRPRLFEPRDEDTAILLGDYLYAHGLVRIAEAGGVPAVATMAELISRCAALQAEAETCDGEAWADAATALGGGDSSASARSRALSLHRARLG